MKVTSQRPAVPRKETPQQKYNRIAGKALRDMQSDRITYAEWGKRQREAVEEFRSLLQSRGH